jgi:hypothetical protein
MLGKKGKAILISLLVILASAFISYAEVNLDIVSNTQRSTNTWSTNIENGTARIVASGDRNTTTGEDVMFTVQGTSGSLLIMDSENYQRLMHNQSYGYNEDLSKRNITNTSVSFHLPAGYYYVFLNVGDVVPIRLTVTFTAIATENSYPLLWLGILIVLIGSVGSVYIYMRRKGQ